MPRGAAVLDLTPADLDDGQYRSAAVVTALAQPRLCGAFYDERVVEHYLAANRRLSAWLSDQLAADAVAEAPAQVVDDFTLLSTCVQAADPR